MEECSQESSWGEEGDSKRGCKSGSVGSNTKLRDGKRGGIWWKSQATGSTYDPRSHCYNFELEWGLEQGMCVCDHHRKAENVDGWMNERVEIRKEGDGCIERENLELVSDENKTRNEKQSIRFV